MDHAEVNRLTSILHQRDATILELRNRPVQVVHETKEVKVVDHHEVDRLNGIILELRNRPPQVVHETHEVKVVDHTEVDRLNRLVIELRNRPP
jgi:hypothetical protein